jgi:hypothetical protein
MRQLRVVLTNGLFIFILYLIIVLSILIMAEMQPVAADETVAPVNYPIQETRPADLPERDITQQRFAPLEATQ